jgi:hypothetical protein
MWVRQTGQKVVGIETSEGLGGDLFVVTVG